MNKSIILNLYSSLFNLFQSMSEFSFLAVPNIEGMRLGWYIQVFGIVFLFGISLFFVFYFWIMYRRRYHLSHQMDDFDRQTYRLHQQLLYQKLQKATGKTKLILFIEYLEKFNTTDASTKIVQGYANISELLHLQGFTQQEIDELSQVLYTDKKLALHLENKIMTLLVDH